MTDARNMGAPGKTKHRVVGPSVALASSDWTPSQTASRFASVRAVSDKLCSRLSPEDATVQSMPDASPSKWHMAHTTWFFEAFILDRFLEEYTWYDDRYRFLFNSYYNALGDMHARPNRGLITRPGLEEIREFRAAIDQRVGEMLGSLGDDARAQAQQLIQLGLSHEQQHQELILTDIKHALWSNPLRPAYLHVIDVDPCEAAPAINWIPVPHGVREIGHDTDLPSFAYDNESPRHKAYIQPALVADRLVTCAEYAAFIDDGGYRRPELWLDAGWSTIREQGWDAPLYWQRDSNASWRVFTLAGMRDLEPTEPVCHVSYFEADAYARWADARLCTEHEWETAFADHPLDDSDEPTGVHPWTRSGEGCSETLRDPYGAVWQWTSSPYCPYPGFKPAPGPIGEYNGKFMCNQFVLRGGSCATPRSHTRATYRNFFAPDSRWQFAGIRLAKDQRD